MSGKNCFTRSRALRTDEPGGDGLLVSVASEGLLLVIWDSFSMSLGFSEVATNLLCTALVFFVAWLALLLLRALVLVFPAHIQLDKFHPVQPFQA